MRLTIEVDVDYDKQLGPRYQIGPEPDFLQQIGQILVNYSECERVIFGIFKAVMRLSEEDAYLLVKYGNLNPEKMLTIVVTHTDRIRPSLLREPLKEAIKLFKDSIALRNEVAHWQWAITDGTAGLAFNSIKGRPDAINTGKSYELSELRHGAWLLAKAAMLLNHVAVCMYEDHSSKLSGPAWAPCNYSIRDELDEWALGFSLQRTREMFDPAQAENDDYARPPSEDTTRQ